MEDGSEFVRSSALTTLQLISQHKKTLFSLLSFPNLISQIFSKFCDEDELPRRLFSFFISQHKIKIYSFNLFI